MTRRSIIMLEANEIPFKVFDFFCNRRPGSALARMLERSHQFQTHAEDKTRFIMPWTTWPSFHRGVNDEAHQIFKFGQWEIETDKRFPPLWSQLARNGIRTGVFSSMQSAPLPENAQDYAFYFPDMFANDASTQPPELRTLQEFNLMMTRESARNVSRRIDPKGAAKVFLSSKKLGLRASTYLDVAKQLGSEIFNPARKGRRRAYQPVIMFDAFMKQLEETRPQFATFFTNHVAAAMHRYWAAVFPEDYEQFNLDAAWVERYKDEIEFAMLKLDDIASGLMKFVDRNPDYMFVIATSMGQAAIPASHVREFLTITDLSKFLNALGVPSAQFEERPAMVPDFSAKVAHNVADALEAKLQRLKINGKPAAFHRDNEFFHISLYDERPGQTTAELNGAPVQLTDIGVGYLVHEDEVACTAQHIPQGALIVYSPHAESKPHTGRVDVSALDFAPSVLQHFGLDVPRYMKQNVQLLAPC